MDTIKLLLVDDEAAFLDPMGKRLEKRGILVSKAHSGQEALETLGAQKNIEVVVLDVKMPGMDGIETLGEVKKHFPLVEAVMLTGHATVETAIEGMKQGAFDYLMKPCAIDTLVEKVSLAADQKRRQEEKIIQARIKEITGRRP
ncbi:MAG: response regulator [Desulfovibrionales bacterium]|nr:response regulator [Desulfovibrionales bacterium]